MEGKREKRGWSWNWSLSAHTGQSLFRSGAYVNFINIALVARGEGSPRLDKRVLRLFGGNFFLLCRWNHLPSVESTPVWITRCISFFLLSLTRRWVTSFGLVLFKYKRVHRIAYVHWAWMFALDDVTRVNSASVNSRKRAKICRGRRRSFFWHRCYSRVPFLRSWKNSIPVLSNH